MLLDSVSSSTSDCEFPKSRRSVLSCSESVEVDSEALLGSAGRGGVALMRPNRLPSGRGSAVATDVSEIPSSLGGVHDMGWPRGDLREILAGVQLPPVVVIRCEVYPQCTSGVRLANHEKTGVLPHVMEILDTAAAESPLHMSIIILLHLGFSGRQRSPYGDLEGTPTLYVNHDAVPWTVVVVKGASLRKGKQVMECKLFSLINIVGPVMRSGPMAAHTQKCQPLKSVSKEMQGEGHEIDNGLSNLDDIPNWRRSVSPRARSVH